MTIINPVTINPTKDMMDMAVVIIHHNKAVDIHNNKAVDIHHNKAAVIQASNNINLDHNTHRNDNDSPKPTFRINVALKPLTIATPAPKLINKNFIKFFFFAF